MTIRRPPTGKDLVFMYRCPVHNTWEIESIFIIGEAVKGSIKVILMDTIARLPGEEDVQKKLDIKQEIINDISI